MDPIYQAMMYSLGFSRAAAHKIWNDEGLQTIKEFGYMDDDAVAMLCKVVRNPGGLIANPGVTPASADAATVQLAAHQPPQIRNPSTKISTCAEENLKLACYQVEFAT